MKRYNYIFLFLIIFIVGCGQQQSGQQPAAEGPSIALDVIANLPDAMVGEAYSYSFCKPDLKTVSELCGGVDGTTNPVDGDSPYTFHLQAGKGFPPFGLILNTNGILKGVPTAEGERNFEVCVKDLDGDQDCGTTSIIVEPAEDTTPLSVSIDSMTCVESGTDGFGFTRFKIEASGTASGPPQTFVSGGYFPVKCGEWKRSNSRGCRRLTDELSTTTWNTVYYEELVSGLELFYSVEVFTRHDDIIETRSSAVCPDVGDR